MLITTPGIYDAIAMSAYHGSEICDAPSISSSGLRAILRCPAKYWWNSNLNPERPREEESECFAIGKAAHDLILDGDGWPSRYFVLPEGYDGRLKKWTAAKEEMEDAQLNGLSILKHDQCRAVKAMAKAFAAHPIAKAFTKGKAEQTIAWKDSETGVWLRVRPDFLPDVRKFIPDFKTTTSAHPDDFARSIFNFGYDIQAAMYLEGIAAVCGDDPDRQFWFAAQEKEAPYIVQPFALEPEVLARGRSEVRKGIRLFAECLSTNKWMGYSADFVSVPLPRWIKGE